MKGFEMKIGVLLATEIEEDGIGYYDRKIFELLNNTSLVENTEVVGIIVGKNSDDGPLRDGLARGLDRGVLLVDEDYDNSNCYLVAKAIASYITNVEQFDLILCGYKSHSGGSSMVPVLLSENLNCNAVLDVSEIDVINFQNILCKSNHDGIIEVIKTNGPTIICSENDKANINPVGLKDMMAAFNKEIKVVSLETICGHDSTIELMGMGKLIGPFKTHKLRKNTIFDQTEMSGFCKEIKELIMQGH